MLEIPSIRLPYPTIQYSTRTNDKVANADSGRWDLRTTNFLKPGFQSKRLYWSLLTGPGVSTAAVTALTTHFNTQLVRTGVCASAQMLNQAVSVPNPTETSLGNELNNLLQSAVQAPDIVILLLKSKDQAIYSDFKWLTDKLFLLQSICVTEANMRPKRDAWNNNNALGQYMANVAMKANLKGGGINHTAKGVDKWLSDTLVLGADVTHPGSGALQGSPSIAAIVGSRGPTGGSFRGKMKMQAARQEVGF
jgi:eukaryotic translation initiation factor 2C